MIKKQKKADINTDKGVQERLLSAAEELFCEHGYKGTSIRDIASSADCNIASVNYYFGGKNNLYVEVWRRHLIPMRDARIAGIEKVMSQNNSQIELEGLLKSFADAFMGSMMDREKSLRLSKLMAREYIERHLPANIFVEEVITPTMSAMRAALIRTCPSLDKSKVSMVIFSLIGQLVHLIHVKEMFLRGGDKLDLPVLEMSEAIEHVVIFSAAGIRSYSKG
jgi:AcrR family transcriptional regulator